MRPSSHALLDAGTRARSTRPGHARTNRLESRGILRRLTASTKRNGEPAAHKPPRGNMTEHSNAPAPAPAFPGGTILGYPRIGRMRELKKALESFWKGATQRGRP